MFNHTVKQCDTPEQKTRLVTALNCVCATRPHFSGLANLLKIYVSNTVETAGITASGRLLINPKFMEHLDLRALAFVLAHELMHLILQTHEREGNFKDHELVNIAHDFIINDDLLDDFAAGNRPPVDALHWPDYKSLVKGWKSAKKYSLEELVTVLRKQNISPKKAWDSNNVKIAKKSGSYLSGGGGGGSLGDILEAAGINASETDSQPDPNSTPDNVAATSSKSTQSDPSGKKRINHSLDILSEEDERSVFPDLSPESLTREQKSVQQAAIRSYTEAVTMDALKKIDKITGKQGNELGKGYGMIDLLRGSYATPWEAALQRWFDAVAPGDRSFAKASRRGAWRTDVVLPGRKREGWTIHIVLDTSGSMTSSLRSALGAIDNFCQNNNVETIHILQCDIGVTADEWLEVGSLENFHAKGFGGSDMTPAMMKLAEDPDVTAVIVLTDGYIDYPQKEPPYETLWAIVDRGNTNFKYGIAIQIDSNEK